MYITCTDTPISIPMIYSFHSHNSIPIIPFLILHSIPIIAFLLFHSYNSIPIISFLLFHSLILAVSYVERLNGHIDGLGYGCLATLMGRYYAMDRDKRYERTQLAYEGLIKGAGERVELSQLTKVGVDLVNKVVNN